MKWGRDGIAMFPYYWNGYNSGGTAFAAGMLSRKDERLQDLPEEVRESLEKHKDEFRSAEDIRHFVDELNLKK